MPWLFVEPKLHLPQRAYQMFGTVCFKGYAGCGGHSRDGLEQRIKINKTFTNRQMVIIAAVIVVEVEVEQFSFYSFEPIRH